MRRCLRALVTVAAASVLPSVVHAQSVTVTVNPGQQAKAISPYVYGSNSGNITASTFDRVGGNRWTAYNWENNASNAGSDWHFNNDNFLTANLPAAQQNVPGAAVLGSIQGAATNGRGLLLTIPIAGYVSQTKTGGNEAGDVRTFPNHLQDHFNQGVAKKNAAFTLTPDTADDFVYQDEFVNWVQSKRAAGQQIFYSMDNEPDLWSHTHNEVHPAAATYAEMVAKTKAYAAAIKDVQSDALIFGAVNYGWQGMRNLQGAPDAAANGRFHPYFLSQMKQAEVEAGRRLLDVLDVHWYPEARGNDATGTSRRIIDDNNDPGVVAARLQAPRSLWDPTYVESSWITNTLPANDKPVRVLTRLKDDINQHYAGTKLAVTEYNYGGGNHVSGGLAQADALGAYGREGVYAANWWDLGTGDRFVNAAFRMYRNFDGKGGAFGDISILADTNDDNLTSVYASLDSTNPKRMVLVLINKGSASVTADLAMLGGLGLKQGKVFQFNAGSAVVNNVVQISQLPDLMLTDPAAFQFSMAPMSVTTIELVPEPGAVGAVSLLGLLAARRPPR